MKPPETAKVMGLEYTLTPNTAMPEFGICQTWTCSILYNPNQHPQQLRDTVLHELMHAVEGAMCVDLDEGDLTRMATGVLTVLRENPKLVKFLLEKDK